jgi:pyruvate carboxylase
MLILMVIVSCVMTEIKRKYIEANELVSTSFSLEMSIRSGANWSGQCGNIIKVTPSSKVVGDFAQWMTQNSLSKAQVLERADELDFPSSVVEFFQGYLGQPVGGFPEPLRSKIIRNKPRIDERPGASMAPLDFKKIKADLRSRFGKHITDADVTSYVMYPKVRGPALSMLSVHQLVLSTGLRGVSGFPAEVRRLEVKHVSHFANFWR